MDGGSYGPGCTEERAREIIMGYGATAHRQGQSKNPYSVEQKAYGWWQTGYDEQSARHVAALEAAAVFGGVSGCM